MHQRNKARQRALRNRCRAKALQRRPDSLLYLGRDRDILLGNQTKHPCLRCGQPGFAVQFPQRLERKVAIEAKIIPGPAERERRTSRRPALVEDEDLRVRIAAELQRQER